MTPCYADQLVELHLGDCLEVMRKLPDASVDSVVTDPPYGLEFMGKEWDKAHRLWNDSANGQQGRIDGRGGMETFGKRPVYKAGRSFMEWCEQWGREALRVTKPGGYLLAFGGTRTHHRLVCGLEDAGWIIRDELDWIYASGFPKGKANLKPAHEPIVLARKPGPLRPLGIDECRIPGAVPSVPQPAFNTTGTIYGMKAGEGRNGEMSQADGRWPSNVLLSDPELFDEPNPWVVGSGATSIGSKATDFTPGEDSARMFPLGHGTEGYNDVGGYSRFFIIPKADRAERERGLADRPQEVVKTQGRAEGRTINPDGTITVHGDTRQARANIHPTVKPIDLMRHLVRLVTPPGGTVLDPFLGSGTTALAASEEGLCCIGIEREADYLEIAKGRLMATPMGLGLDLSRLSPARGRLHL